MASALYFAGGFLRLHTRAAAVLLGAVARQDPTGVTAWVRHPVAERESSLARSTGALRARLYTPVGRTRPPTLLFFPGVHYAGIDEPRFMRFARSMASVGIEVVTPELPDLLEYRVTTRTIADIREVGRLFARTGRKPGAFGISFTGGLVLMAAAQAPDAFAYVVAAGSHHDLARVVRYYAGQTVTTPDGEPVPQHVDPYGARVIVRAHVEHFFTPDDVETARRAIDLKLTEHYAQARAVAKTLSPDGQDRMRIVLNDDRFAELGQLLLDALDTNSLDLSSVSPKGSLGGLKTPTLLVHGAGDPIIPAAETLWLAREVPSDALERVLVTPVLGHVDFAKDVGALDYWRMIRFIAAILRHADA